VGRPLRLLTANLYNGAADPSALVELVRAHAPDVVAVQELGPEQAEALSSVLPHGVLEPATDFTGMGIALRAPAALRRVPLAYRDARVALLEPSAWPGLAEPLEIVNVHFAAPTARPLWRQPGVRRRQLRGLLAHLDSAPDRACAVAGDFNATPLWPAYRRLRTRFDDAVAGAARRVGRRPGRTWGPWSGSMRLLRIDHVLVQGLVATETRVLHLRGSDHSALVADLRLPPG
jgi:endonuclease/exonuclease/phosphatase family metal-dependent hydrolase